MDRSEGSKNSDCIPSQSMTIKESSRNANHLLEERRIRKRKANVSSSSLRISVVLVLLALTYTADRLQQEQQTPGDRNSQTSRGIPSFFVLGFVPTQLSRPFPKYQSNVIRRSITRTRRRNTAASLESTLSSAQRRTGNPGSRWNRFWNRIITGRSSPSPKPPWLSPSMAKILPSWIFHLRPSVQLLLTLVIYLFHTVVLTQHSLVLPFQLLPNDRGNFQSIGLDS